MSNELKLKHNTLITSKTDLKGNITYANDDFLKYAGYKMEEILYKPHNIIRHSDMPKAAFKLLWDYIQNKKEFFAFVKNKSKNGDFYWVFANITPSFDDNGKIIGYYSVRRKPNEKALTIIENLYKDLLETEQKFGMNKAIQSVEELCKKEGKTYNELIFELQTKL